MAEEKKEPNFESDLYWSIAANGIAWSVKVNGRSLVLFNKSAQVVVRYAKQAKATTGL